MGSVDWGDPTVSLTELIATAALNSLANGSTVLSAAINNETNEAMYSDWELKLGSIDTTTPANPAIELRFIESIDGGTTYGNATAGATTGNHSAKPPAVIFPLRAGTAAEAKVQVVTMVPIPPGYFKVEFKNRSGATLNGTSGNSLQYRTYKVEVA